MGKCLSAFVLWLGDRYGRHTEWYEQAKALTPDEPAYR